MAGSGLNTERTESRTITATEDVQLPRSTRGDENVLIALGLVVCAVLNQRLFAARVWIAVQISSALVFTALIRPFW